MAVATTSFPDGAEDAGPVDPPTKKLNQPIMLSATGRTRLPVIDAGGAAALAAYMALPGEPEAVVSGTMFLGRSRLADGSPVSSRPARLSVSCHSPSRRRAWLGANCADAPLRPVPPNLTS